MPGLDPSVHLGKSDEALLDLYRPLPTDPGGENVGNEVNGRHLSHG
jgi:hypothetical protein